jgi:hypothetical protein
VLTFVNNYFWGKAQTRAPKCFSVPSMWTIRHEICLFLKTSNGAPGGLSPHNLQLQPGAHKGLTAPTELPDLTR